MRIFLLHLHWRSTRRLAVVSSVLLASQCFLGDTQLSAQSSLVGLTQYQIGEPSGDETAILELLNRSRANPPAEGRSLAAAINPADYGSLQDEYQATVHELLTDFGAYPFRPPLAFNAHLNAAAQFHLAENIAAGVDAHNSPDGTTPGQRVQRFGYNDESGENCSGLPNYPPVYTPWNIEASYEYDDGVPGYGHRLNLLEPVRLWSVEIGIAERALGGWSVQDFGGNHTVTLLTGVAYTDNAATGFYASGEGVGGVTVTAPGASSFYAVTTASGAYTLPLDLLPAYDAAAPLASVTIQMSCQGNAKALPVVLTHTVDTLGDTYFQYDDASQTTGHPRYDNAKADWAFPAAAGATPTPTPVPAPTPAATPSVSIALAPGGAVFVVTRTGNTAGELVVRYTVKGTAVAGTDYQPLPGTRKMKAGRANVLIKVKTLPGGHGTIKLKLAADAIYTVGAPVQAKWKLP